MDERNEKQNSIGLDVVEAASEGLAEVTVDGVFGAAGDVVGELAGAVIGGIFDGI